VGGPGGVFFVVCRGGGGVEGGGVVGGVVGGFGGAPECQEVPFVAKLLKLLFKQFQCLPTNVFCLFFLRDPRSISNPQAPQTNEV